MRKVALIEDNPICAKVLTALFESVGLSCDYFKGAESFLECYQNKNFECIISDIRLQGLSGI